MGTEPEKLLINNSNLLFIQQSLWKMQCNQLPTTSVLYHYTKIYL